MEINGHVTGIALLYFFFLLLVCVYEEGWGGQHMSRTIAPHPPYRLKSVFRNVRIRHGVCMRGANSRCIMLKCTRVAAIREYSITACALIDGT
jgi:hypothetical protein